MPLLFKFLLKPLPAGLFRVSWIMVMAGVPEIKYLKETKKKQQEENRDLALEIVSNPC